MTKRNFETAIKSTIFSAFVAVACGGVGAPTGDSGDDGGAGSESTGADTNAGGGTGGSANTGGVASAGGTVNTGGTETGGSSSTGGTVNTGGTETGGSSSTGGTVNTGGSSETGGNSSGGNQNTGGVIEPNPVIPFTLDHCNGTAGPTSEVRGSEVGAFDADGTWMDGWTNWSTNSNKANLVVPVIKVTLQGELGDADLDWTNDKAYVLDGYVRVPVGKTLTIHPGTIILGQINTMSGEAGTLFVTQGAKISAVGTLEEPIVFTSMKANGAKAAGDWGGVVLLGKAHVRQSKIFYEGLSGALYPWATMGGDGADDNGDDSGELKYVRIEFGGAVLQSNKEINGLSFGAVGSGTKISYVQVNNNKDDCFEWFGGTVNVDHLVCNNSGDDQFDVDDSYQGSIEYIFGRGTINSSTDPVGLEADGVSDIASPEELVATNVTIRHATICGSDGLFGVPAYGTVLRRGIRGILDDVFFVGWDASIDTRDDFQSVTPGTADMVIKNSASSQAFYGPGDTDEVDNDNGFDEDAWFTVGEGNKNWDK